MHSADEKPTFGCGETKRFEHSQLARVLQQSVAQAGGELQRRIQELEAQNEALRRAGRAKDELLAAASHELRNAVNGVLGSVELLTHNATGGGPDCSGLLEVIESNAGQLLSLIDDMLDLSRAESGTMQLQLQPVSIAAVCAQSMSLVRTLARSRRLTVELQIDDSADLVRADPQRLRQVLGKLLHNASKFTPPGGRIGLRVRRAGARALFEVWDAGVGLSGEQVEKLRAFAPFTQFNHAGGCAGGGAGLGLAVAKRLLDLHGGKLHIRSRPATGSEFTVEIPLAAEAGELRGAGRQHSASQVAQPPVSLPRQISVLLVDDKPANIATASRYLRNAGFNVLTAETAACALRILGETIVDVMVCDLQMPDMDGLTLVRRVRGDLQLADLQIIGLSARPAQQARQTCLTAGMDEYLTKPVRLAALAATLAQLRSSSSPGTPGVSGSAGKGQER